MENLTTITSAVKLTTEGSERLRQLEVLIRNEMGSFLAVGEAFAEVERKHLYGPGDFESYCLKWKLTPRPAIQALQKAWNHCSAKDREGFLKWAQEQEATR
jgi:hypothetical protein